MNNTTKRRVLDTTVWTSAVLMTFVLLMHDAAADSRLLQVTSVRTPANCGACHTTAERGDFSERGARVPR